MTRDPDRVNFATLSALVLAGLLIWAAHFLVIYGVTGLACARRFADMRVLGFGIVEVTVAGATALALLAAGAVGLGALRYARRGESVGFLGWLTATTALLAVVAIAWDGLPILFMPPCQ